MSGTSLAIGHSPSDKRHDAKTQSATAFHCVILTTGWKEPSRSPDR